MNIQATCKFCKKPIVLTIDDSYNLLEDPFGLKRLVSLAACQHCADYKVARRPIYEMIARCANRLQWNKDPKNIADTKETLAKLLQRYMRLIADFKRMPVPDWDETLVEAIAGNPVQFADVLKRVPLMFAQRKLL